MFDRKKGAEESVLQVLELCHFVILCIMTDILYENNSS